MRVLTVLALLVACVFAVLLGTMVGYLFLNPGVIR